MLRLTQKNTVLTVKRVDASGNKILVFDGSSKNGTEKLLKDLALKN